MNERDEPIRDDEISTRGGDVTRSGIDAAGCGRFSLDLLELAAIGKVEAQQVPGLSVVTESQNTDCDT